MTAEYRKCLKDLADLLGWSDLELTDFYNGQFGKAVPCPIYRFVKDYEARQLFSKMTVELEEKDNRRRRRF